MTEQKISLGRIVHVIPPEIRTYGENVFAAIVTKVCDAEKGTVSVSMFYDNGGRRALTCIPHKDNMPEDYKGHYWIWPPKV